MPAMLTDQAVDLLMAISTGAIQKHAAKKYPAMAPHFAVGKPEDMTLWNNGVGVGEPHIDSRLQIGEVTARPIVKTGGHVPRGPMTPANLGKQNAITGKTEPLSHEGRALLMDAIKNDPKLKPSELQGHAASQQGPVFMGVGPSDPVTGVI